MRISDMNKLSENERIIRYYNNLINNEVDEIIEYRFDNYLIYHLIISNLYYIEENVEISKSDLIKLLLPYMRRIKLEKICLKQEIK